MRAGSGGFSGRFFRDTSSLPSISAGVDGDRRAGYSASPVKATGRSPHRGAVALATASDGLGGFDLSQRLAQGEEVGFLACPLAERAGRLVEMDEARRVPVLLEIMGAARIICAAPDSFLPARI
jgi:hypothetical protein